VLEIKEKQIGEERTLGCEYELQERKYQEAKREAIEERSRPGGGASAGCDMSSRVTRGSVVMQGKDNTHPIASALHD
jgi:hypothetical protein